MTEETIETGDVTFTITDTNGTIKNATVIIESQNEAFNGFTDKDGEITFNEVPYDTYDVTVKHTGYEITHDSNLGSRSRQHRLLSAVISDDISRNLLLSLEDHLGSPLETDGE